MHNKKRKIVGVIFLASVIFAYFIVRSVQEENEERGAAIVKNEDVTDSGRQLVAEPTVDYVEGDVEVHFAWEDVVIEPSFSNSIGPVLEKSLSPNKKYLYVATGQGGGWASFIYEIGTNKVHFLRGPRDVGHWLSDGRLEVVGSYVFESLHPTYRSESQSEPWKIREE
jgi:hypothetical protein